MRTSEDKQWPLWVSTQPALMKLFCIMQPIDDDDDDDVAKAWGIDAQLKT